MILSCKVQFGTSASVYATGDKVYLGEDNRWVAERRDAAVFADASALVHAIATFALARGGMPPLGEFTGYEIERS